MGELRVGAEAIGSDGTKGTVDLLIVDPTSDTVTNLVVSRGLADQRVLVPEDAVISATPDLVELSLDAAGLEACLPFDEVSYTRPEAAWAQGAMAVDPGAYFLEPFVTPVDAYATAGHERVPRGQVAVRRGTPVLTSDGTSVGSVDELVVDPADGHITHVVLREHHLLTPDHDVVVPITHATTFDADLVMLDLDVEQLGRLEQLPVHRHHHVGDEG